MNYIGGIKRIEILESPFFSAKISDDSVLESEVNSFSWIEIQNLLPSESSLKSSAKTNLAGVYYDNTVEAASVSAIKLKDGLPYILKITDHNDRAWIVGYKSFLQLTKAAYIPPEPTQQPKTSLVFEGRSVLPILAII